MADAGWYPDPRGRHEHRYFDGTAWTDHVADDGRGSTDPVNAPAPPAAPPPSMPAVDLPAPSGSAPPPPGTAPPPTATTPPPSTQPSRERTPGWYPEPIAMPTGSSRPAPFARARRPRRAVGDVREYSTAVRILVFGGAIALVAAAFLPWVRASIGGISVEQKGLDGDGTFTLLCGIAAAVLFWVVVSQAGRLITLLAGAFALVVSVYDIADVNSKANELSTASGLFQIDASVGIGLWISALASIALVLGAVLALREAR
jgi:hypothetical protein